jgi:hypothetical protein
MLPIELETKSGRLEPLSSLSLKMMKMKSSGPIAEPEIAGVDEDTDNEHVEILYKYTSAYWSHFNSLVVCRIVDRGGSQTLETVEHEGHRLLREALESNHCYVLDSLNEVYVWQGRTSATPARRAALKLAREVHAKRARANIAGTLLPYTSSFTLPAIYLSITLLLPRYFIGLSLSSAASPRVTEQKVDATKMLRGVEPPQEKIYDDGSGQVQVHLIWFVCCNVTSPLSADLENCRI